ncbi:piggyBac transposable element-derived protein 4-like [Ixodes scapularis]
MPGKASLTPEEALDLFYSLPDDPHSSEEDGDSSEEEFIPQLAPPDSSEEETEDADAPSTSRDAPSAGDPQLGVGRLQHRSSAIVFGAFKEMVAGVDLTRCKA